MRKTLNLKNCLFFLQVPFQTAQRTFHKLKEPLHLISEGNDISSAHPAVWSGTAESTQFWVFPCLLGMRTGLEMSLFRCCGISNKIVLLVHCSLEVKA